MIFISSALSKCYIVIICLILPLSFLSSTTVGNTKRSNGWIRSFSHRSNINNNQYDSHNHLEDHDSAVKAPNKSTGSNDVNHNETKSSPSVDHNKNSESDKPNNVSSIDNKIELKDKEIDNSKTISKNNDDQVKTPNQTNTAPLDNNEPTIKNISDKKIHPIPEKVDLMVLYEHILSTIGNLQSSSEGLFSSFSDILGPLTDNHLCKIIVGRIKSIFTLYIKRIFDLGSDGQMKLDFLIIEYILELRETVFEKILLPTSQLSYSLTIIRNENQDATAIQFKVDNMDFVINQNITLSTNNDIHYKTLSNARNYKVNVTLTGASVVIWFSITNLNNFVECKKFYMDDMDVKLSNSPYLSRIFLRGLIKIFTNPARNLTQTYAISIIDRVKRNILEIIYEILWPRAIFDPYSSKTEKDVKLSLKSAGKMGQLPSVV